MTEFDESKHPRDEDGKFTSKDGSKEYRQNTSYGEILGRKSKKKFFHKLANVDKNNFREHTAHAENVYKKGYIAGAKKGNKMSFTQADNGACNPYYNKIKGYKENCQTCVAVYVARRLGYNVRALPYFYNGPYANDTMRTLANNPYKAYKDIYGEQPQSIEYDGSNKQEFLEKTIKKSEIYSVSVGWKDGNYHIIIAEKDKNGELFLYDPQSNKKYTNNKVSQYFNKTKGRIVCANLTNVTMNEIVCDKVMKKVN